MGQWDEIVGVLLLGIMFNTYLYGLVTYQFITYYTSKYNDALWIRAIVGCLFFVDTAHSCVAIYAAWETCVTNYTNPAYFATVSWTIPFTACATSVAAFLSQGFLGHRVLILTKSKLLAGVIGVFSFLGFFFGFYAGIYSGILHEVAKFGPLGPFVTCWLTFQTAADVMITVTLIWTLKKARTGFRKTDTIINRLIRGAVQTGLFASIFALCDMFAFQFRRETYLYAMFAYPIGRIYTNTLLDTLNARNSLKQQNGATMDVESEGNTAAFRMTDQPRQDMSHTVHSIHVKQDIVTDVATASIEERDVKYKTDDVYQPSNGML
ncbi:hypothetical protein P691DRAFT_698895 [Macrolepiota fuliginosa MF-IS2]|uniref:DUF6534 domain-containing protein n=1 Tax=Macrolepiota fuliginosa MF-IS2 TaxID=1400762 RepID=A0A9P5XJ42_9AGAR|nr:hypothetical protein P691DRAFT_698895 [Macrolepiota fuliginosa MF-IS2]